jgi:hypothetical protein
MGNTVRASVCVLAAAVIGSSTLVALERASDLPVRTADPVLAMAVQGGTDRSPTFLRLHTEIATLKGIVYLHPGKCLDLMRSCLLQDMSRAGSYRLLHVMVDTGQDSVDVTGAVGHELQHAIEILRANVHTKSAILAFYMRYGKRISGHFETDDASRIAEVIRTELRRLVRHARADANAAVESRTERTRRSAGTADCSKCARGTFLHRGDTE